MRAESAWASEIRAGARVGSIWRARSAAHRAGGERGRQAGRQASRQAGMRRKERETRTRGSLACSWGCFGVKVEVDERVQLLERERLCSFVVDEHTLPFLRGLLVALEYYHLIILAKPNSVCCCWGGESEVSRTNVDRGALDPHTGYFPPLVHLECAWLDSVYRCGLVVVCGGRTSISRGGKGSGAHI